MVEPRKPVPETKPAVVASPKAASAAERLKDNPSPQQAPPPDPKRKLTPEEETAKKAADEAAKVEGEAHEKAGRINANLAKDGSPRRITGGVRNGKPVFHWCNTVPTQELTEDELKAVEGMK
jgi:hypothetical protein